MIISYPMMENQVNSQDEKRKTGIAISSNMIPYSKRLI